MRSSIRASPSSSASIMSVSVSVSSIYVFFFIIQLQIIAISCFQNHHHQHRNPLLPSLARTSSRASASASSVASSSSSSSSKTTTKLNLTTFWQNTQPTNSESATTTTAIRPNGGGGGGGGQSDKIIIPFIIEEVTYASKKDSQDISNLVIQVFFQEEAEKKIESRSTDVTPWKAMQLAYLQNLQYGDVKGKKFVLGGAANNSMFVARRVVPDFNNFNNNNAAAADDGDDEMNDNDDDTNIDMSKVFNREYLENTNNNNNNNNQYKKGPILGFVDVTEKNFGLAADPSQLIGYDENQEIASGKNTPIRRKSSNKRPLRPVLTNLAVKEEARCSGVGSALVEACEDVVMSDKWSKKYYEMVLEVEEENEPAQKFYEKRGYAALFADPTSRRYDTAGIFLKSVRTTKITYRKDMSFKRAQQAAESATNGGIFGSMFFAKVKDSLKLLQ